MAIESTTNKTTIDINLFKFNESEEVNINLIMDVAANAIVTEQLRNLSWTMSVPLVVFNLDYWSSRMILKEYSSTGVIQVNFYEKAN